MTERLRKDVDLADLRRTRPISATWGYDRGTPIDRHYIEAFLASHAEDIHGYVLEFGDDSYARRFGGDRVARTAVLDFNPANERATYNEDIASGGGLPAGEFDCVICTQTLQLIYDVDAAIGALARAIKPGGVLLGTVPGITRISVTEWPESWFWSFSSASVRRLFSQHFGEANVSVRAYGNVLAATAFLYGLASEELAPAELEEHDPEFEVSITIRAVQLDRR